MTTDRITACAYVRVSSNEQGVSGLGLDAQLHAIRTYVEGRGWELGEVFSDVGKSGTLPPRSRPGLKAALAHLESEGHAGVLVVAKMDRLGRSLGTWAHVLERIRERGWRLVLLDFDLDTSSAAGRLVANVLATVAAFESERAGERMVAAWDARRRRGSAPSHPLPIGDDLLAMLSGMRAGGTSWRELCSLLDERGPRAERGRWTVDRLRKAWKRDGRVNACG
jgi:DNA invertase Pin-like site-specific DNA recombinase